MASSTPSRKPPKSLARACLSCRTRKTRCDGRQPQCTACSTLGKECEYRIDTPRQRPTFSKIHALQHRQASLEALVLALHRGDPETRESLLASAVDDQGKVTVPARFRRPDVQHGQSPSLPKDKQSSESPDVPSEDELEISHFISRDEAGMPRSFGPSSALHVPTQSDAPGQPSSRSATNDHMRNALIANAALSRQLEHGLNGLNAIEGVPTPVALKLLHCHWTRQHHTFLLTYRPAIMRDLLNSGPHASPFLINAIFACSSKFSGLVEVRDDPTDPATAGRRFFARCDELLAQQALLMQPTIPTVVGLLLLGSTYNARGETSKGWLYTGYALRMVYDLGLHLDPRETTNVPEEIEIRRRVFWGAFVCDKLQSLYLGRPMAINLRDSRVSLDLLDTYEEREIFLPASGAAIPSSPTPILSVSTFQQLCFLSKIMTTIINRFYVIGATHSNAQSGLQAVESALQKWRESLPAELEYQPWEPTGTEARNPPPNVMVVHNLYHTLVILLHRPFISDGHLRAAGLPARSWERCSEAARRITHISRSYRDAFTLSAAPYVLGYAIYVACTIHVRNAASRRRLRLEYASLLAESVRCLDELCLANPGIAKPASIIRRMIRDHKLDLDLGEREGTVVGNDTNSLGAAEQPQFADPITPSFDLDAIVNMFPVSGSMYGEFSIGSDDFRPGFDPDLSYDPLFGLMDGPS